MPFEDCHELSVPAGFRPHRSGIPQSLPIGNGMPTRNLFFVFRRRRTARKLRRVARLLAALSRV
jgi:hypothetical protein